MKVIHLGTKITMQLGLEDDDGNVIDSVAADNFLQVFSMDEYKRAFEQAAQFREQWRLEKCPADS